MTRFISRVSSGSCPRARSAARQLAKIPGCESIKVPSRSLEGRSRSGSTQRQGISRILPRQQSSLPFRQMEISDERRQNCVDGSCRSHNAPEADVSFGSFARILRCPPSRPLSTIYCAPLARPFAAMRSWLAVSDCAHAAREARGRSMWVGIFAQNHTERHAIAGPRAFSGLCDDEGVPLICPTCQVLPPKRPCRRPPATLHGVVFDIFVGSHSDPARLRESCLKPHTPARPLL